MRAYALATIVLGVAFAATAVGAPSNLEKRVRAICDDLGPDEKKRTTDGSEAWKSKLAVEVTDSGVYAPAFGTWRLDGLAEPNKPSKVKHRGPFYGFGLAVEIENKSDQVLEDEAIYVWATFDTDAGPQECFASSRGGRSWNPFGGKGKAKGKGAWESERSASEMPFRPKEKKRYHVIEEGCPSASLREMGIKGAKLEVYVGFRTLGGDRVIAGPFATVERDGATLSGAPVASSAASQTHVGGKNDVPVTAHYVWGDHVLVTDAKKALWVDSRSLSGSATPASQAAPAATSAHSATFGKLSLNAGPWTQLSWKSLAGAVSPGRRRVVAQVSVQIDASEVAASLDAALAAAKAGADGANQDVDAKQSAYDAAKAAKDAAKGTDGADAAKEAEKAAKAELKAAQKAAKTMAKGVKAAEKARAKGVNAFFKEQAKQLDCGSFRLDTGSSSLKPLKGSITGKNCKALLKGEKVESTLIFELGRWDVPFALTYSGPGKKPQVAPLLSQKLGAVPAE